MRLTNTMQTAPWEKTNDIGIVASTSKAYYSFEAGLNEISYHNYISILINAAITSISQY